MRAAVVVQACTTPGAVCRLDSAADDLGVARSKLAAMILDAWLAEPAARERMRAQLKAQHAVLEAQRAAAAAQHVPGKPGRPKKVDAAPSLYSDPAFCAWLVPESRRTDVLRKLAGKTDAEVLALAASLPAETQTHYARAWAAESAKRAGLPAPKPVQHYRPELEDRDEEPDEPE